MVNRPQPVHRERVAPVGSSRNPTFPMEKCFNQKRGRRIADWNVWLCAIHGEFHEGNTPVTPENDTDTCK
jgi:hypothetical protein